MSAAPARWQNARNVLCVRLDNLGDVLMTTPAIRALKAAAPERCITLLASAAGAQVARYLPDIDRVLHYDAPWMKPPSSGTEGDRAMVESLAQARFDAAVLFTVYSQSALPAALLCRLAGIPLRIAHCRENPYELLTDWVRETEPDARVRHEAQRQLDLVAETGASTADVRLRFEVPSAARAQAARLLAEVGVRPPFIALHPGASAASRRYPAAKFAAVARALAVRRGCAVLITGGAGEQELAACVCALACHPRVRNVAGALDLGGLGALIERAALLIANNSGPAHIAAAVGTPVVDLYALTNPQHTPWGVPHRVLYRDVPCRYCYKSVCPLGHNDCLHSVEPREVVAAACELLDAPAQVAASAHAPLPPLRQAAH